MKQNMLNTSQLRNFLYVSIISADNDDLTEEEKQAIIQRTDPKKSREYELGLCVRTYKRYRET